jgi:hypothetical protein
MLSERKWFTPDEILEAYLLVSPCTEGQRATRKNQLTQHLNKAGFKKTNPVSFKAGSLGPQKKQLRFWNVCGPEEAAGTEIAEDYLKDKMLLTRLTGNFDGIE